MGKPDCTVPHHSCMTHFPSNRIENGQCTQQRAQSFEAINKKSDIIKHDHTIAFSSLMTLSASCECSGSKAQQVTSRIWAYQTLQSRHLWSSFTMSVNILIFISPIFACESIQNYNDSRFIQPQRGDIKKKTRITEAHWKSREKITVNWNWKWVFCKEKPNINTSQRLSEVSTEELCWVYSCQTGIQSCNGVW